MTREQNINQRGRHILFCVMVHKEPQALVLLACRVPSIVGDTARVINVVGLDSRSPTWPYPELLKAHMRRFRCISITPHDHAGLG